MLTGPKNENKCIRTRTSRFNTKFIIHNRSNDRGLSTKLRYANLSKFKLLIYKKNISHYSYIVITCVYGRIYIHGIFLCSKKKHIFMYVQFNIEYRSDSSFPYFGKLWKSTICKEIALLMLSVVIGRLSGT